MLIKTNARIRQTATPPIAEVRSWIDDYRGGVGPVLDVAQAVPSYPPDETLRRHLAAAIQDGESAFYTEIAGLPALRQELADHMSAAYQANISISQVAITAGCNQAFCVALSALAGPGDEVILPLPCYFNHHMWLDMQGIRAIHLPLAEDAGGIPDPTALDRLLTTNTRAIALVTPNNPTGAEYPPAVIHAFHDRAREAGVALILDETYKDFRDADGPAHTLFQRPDWPDTLIQLYSFSKAYSLTGYRVGSVIAGEELQREIAKLLDCMTICAPRVGQLAALYGLQHLSAWRDARAADMKHRITALRQAFARPGLTYRLISSGAYFAYVRHPFPDRDSAWTAQMLARNFGVLCLPGVVFGPDQEAYLRFAFANLGANQMQELVDRLLASQSATGGTPAQA